MFTFIVIISLLIILALAFVLPALFKKSSLEESNFDELNTQIARDRLSELKQLLAINELSQEDFEQAKRELENTLALDLSASASTENKQQIGSQNSKPAALLLLISVPVASSLLYMQIGQFDAVNGQKPVQQEVEQQAPKLSMEDAAAQLAIRLQSEPDNAEGWFMLARTYMTMKRYDEAVAAYKKTTELVTDNANVLIRYADALAMSRKGSLTGEPRAAIEKALKIEPDNQQGLWLAGMAAVEAKEFKLALRYMLILQPMLANNPEYLSQLHGLIARVEKNLSTDEIDTVVKAIAVEFKVTTKPESAAAVAIAEIQVSVTISDELKAQVSATDTVFIYAKAVNGPPMPLAASKQKVSSLPLTISLNDDMAMMPAMKLSNFDRVIIGAKISKSGVAGSAAGDLYGEVTNVEVKTGQKVSLVINKIKS
jgi:cytochrome c-type biogenesis protein CcmH